MLSITGECCRVGQPIATLDLAAAANLCGPHRGNESLDDLRRNERGEESRNAGVARGDKLRLRILRDEGRTSHPRLLKANDASHMQADVVSKRKEESGSMLVLTPTLR